EPRAQYPRHGPQRDLIVLRVSVRAVEDDRDAGARLAAEAELFLDDARRRPHAVVAPAAAALRGRQPADVALDERPDRIRLELPDEDEGEAAGVGEPLPVDLEGALRIERLDVRGGERTRARMVLGQNGPERVGEVRFRTGHASLAGRHLALLPGLNRVIVEPGRDEVEVQE